jgi:two-component system OmpR family response regulator
MIHRLNAMRILLVEDDLKIASFIKKGLKAAGFAVDHVTDGEEGLHMALTEPYDTAIVDIMLPKRDGLSIVEEIRKKKISTPVIILSAKGSIDDRVKGLQTGSDDYLTKPFAFSELLARVQALIRRASGASEPTRLMVGDCSMNLLTREVLREGKKIELQPLEFSLLEYLMRNAGKVVSKTMIMEHVWDYNFDPQTNVVEVRISRLRDKIDKGFTTKLIRTVRGVGYVLKEPA